MERSTFYYSIGQNSPKFYQSPQKRPFKPFFCLSRTSVALLSFSVFINARKRLKFDSCLLYLALVMYCSISVLLK